RFGAVTKALPDEDGARLLGPLVFDRGKPAGGKDAAGQRGNEKVGTDAHKAASYGIATGTGRLGATLRARRSISASSAPFHSAHRFPAAGNASRSGGSRPGSASRRRHRR